MSYHHGPFLQASEAQSQASSGEVAQMREMQRLREALQESEERCREMQSAWDQERARWRAEQADWREEKAAEEERLRKVHGKEMEELAEDYKVSWHLRLAPENEALQRKRLVCSAMSGLLYL